jgi:hypothetical protein
MQIALAQKVKPFHNDTLRLTATTSEAACHCYITGHQQGAELAGANQRAAQNYRRLSNQASWR